MANISRTGRWVITIAVIGAVVLVASVVGTLLMNRGNSPLPEYAGEWTPGEPKYPVEILPVPASAMVEAGTVDGHAVNARCDTCHAGREANVATVSGEQLKDFHEGLVFDHGKGALSCMACHNEDDYETLRKPDGTRVPFDRAMELCAQCHGPQYRDYLAGAHGGMTGFWDLQRGGRTRNSCLHCHDPHAPSFAKILPMPPPKVRAGLPSATGSHHGHDEETTHE